MAVVVTRNLTKVFKEGELGAVNNVNLETREGEFLVFLGPSGSGKTTLLRMIAGLETPTSGEILIGGRVVNDLSPRERRIAMVFQSYALYPHLSVYKNIAFPLKAQNVKKELHKAKVEWASSLLGIGALLDRKPRELSGGARHRARACRLPSRRASFESRRQAPRFRARGARAFSPPRRHHHHLRHPRSSRSHGHGRPRHGSQQGRGAPARHSHRSL